MSGKRPIAEGAEPPRRLRGGKRGATSSSLSVDTSSSRIRILRRATARMLRHDDRASASGFGTPASLFGIGRRGRDEAPSTRKDGRKRNRKRHRPSFLLRTTRSNASRKTRSSTASSRHRRKTQQLRNAGTNERHEAPLKVMHHLLWQMRASVVRHSCANHVA